MSAGQEFSISAGSMHTCLSSLYHNRQELSRGELGTVVTLCVMGFGVLTLIFFFDNLIRCRREACCRENTQSFCGLSGRQSAHCSENDNRAG